MLSKKIYVIRQTPNVNLVAEQFGQNIVGKQVRLQDNLLDKFGFSLSDNVPEVRAYLIGERGEAIGPILGLEWEDLDEVKPLYGYIPHI